MTEDDATKLLVSAASLAANVAALIPALVQNFQATKDGLASDNADELNARIVVAHGEVQALDAQLQTLRSQ